MKKIILSLIIVITALICGNYVHGVRPLSESQTSYIAAKNKYWAELKIKFYNTQGQSENKGIWDDNLTKMKKELELEGKDVSLAYGYISVPSWNKVLKTSYYRKYIYKTTLNGQVAFCLDPGLSSNTDYKQVSTSESKFSELSEKEKMYAIIYNADFSSLKIYYNNDDLGIKAGNYNNTLTTDENTEYIIKQLLFWAYENNSTIFTFYNRGEPAIQYEAKFVGLAENVLGIKLPVTSTGILEEDIYAAILHYNTGTNKIISKAGATQDGTNIGTFNFKYKNFTYPDGTDIITPITYILTESYRELRKDTSPITITKYTPSNGNTTDYQEFLGVYIPPEPETTPKKYYAVVTNLNGTKTVTTNYTEFTNNINISAPNVGNAWKCTGYNVYKSVSSYDGPINLVNNMITGTSIASSTCNLNYANAAEYNVIVFNYEYSPGTLTVEKIITYKNGSQSGPIDKYTKKLSENRYVEIPSTYTYNGFAYNYSYYTKNGVKGTGTSKLTIPAGAEDVKITIYYVESSTMVVVRHFTKQSNGTYKLNNNLANPTAIVQNKTMAYNGAAINSLIIVNNKYSLRKSVANNRISTFIVNEIKNYINFEYSEFYEIGKSDKIIIDRSRTLILDGIYYQCIGFKTKSTSSSNNDLTISKSDVNTTSSLRQYINGGSEYVYIDYYYDPEDYSKDAEPKEAGNSIGSSARLKYITKSATDYGSLGTNNSVVTSTQTNAKESDNIAYVPATENLKPYVTSEICRPRTVRYSISLSGGNVVYGLYEYKAWGLSNSGNLAAVTSSSAVGTGANKVYNSQVAMNFSNVGNINSVISTSINKLKNASTVFDGATSNSNTSFRGLLKSVTDSKTKETDYANSAAYNVASDKYNGFRNSAGTVRYKIYDVIAGTSTSETTVNISQDNSMSINVYTPVAVADSTIKSINFVNHSDVENSNTGIIQQGVEFSITVSTENKTYPDSLYNNIKTTGKYVKNWYLKFDFDVEYNGKSYSAADSEYICVPASHNDNLATTTISGLKAISSDKESLTNSIKNNVKVIASTINMPDNPVGTYADSKIKAVEAKKSSNGTERISVGYIGKGTTSDLGIPNASYYLVSKLKRTTTIGRIFDFEITDCLDVNFKDVFRDINSNDNTVNALTGTRYFSGIRRLLVTDAITSTTTNNLVQRSNLVVGTVAKILPVGPYKHTSNSYIQAVKLGYRFSFDVKTSGYYNASNDNDVTRSIKVTPSYYYISKDGSKYIENIKLYYKNSSGKYVDFETSNYTIYYKPDDGYRNLYNSSLYTGGSDVSKTSKDGNTTLTNTLVALRLGNKSGFSLTDNGSMTTSDQGFLQAWYGEFKIPNSTIALEVDSEGKIDINNPLTDGYIGVKFKLECIDTYKAEGASTATEVKISYDSNDKGMGNNAKNTTQWDYEGYLGFSESNIGKDLVGSLKIQLEKGVWNIDSQSLYEKVKGTVIFYDIDNKAADDYN